MLCSKSFSRMPKRIGTKISDCQLPIKDKFLAIFYRLNPNNYYFQYGKCGSNSIDDGGVYHMFIKASHSA